MYYSDLSRMLLFFLNKNLKEHSLNFIKQKSYVLTKERPKLQNKYLTLTLTSNIFMNITLYMTWNALICTILFGLSESLKITLFKDLIGKIIEAKVVAENCFFFVTLNSIISRIKSLNKVILYDSYGPNRIVQINVVHDIFSDIFIKILDAKVLYAI